MVAAAGLKWCTGSVGATDDGSRLLRNFGANVSNDCGLPARAAAP
ncbi:hypothetical protein [Polaromonas sp. CG9_12]|nr:hypothetical protein [Polaromonas sp. CG9_12]